MQFSILFPITMLLSLSQAAPAETNGVATQPLVARAIDESGAAEVKRAVQDVATAHVLARQPLPPSARTCSGNDGSPGVCDTNGACRRRIINRIPGRNGPGEVIGPCPLPGQ
ncbi:hypothetical protein ACKVV1_005797 [Pyricularia oryzae]